MKMPDTPFENLLLTAVALLIMALAWQAWQVKRQSPTWPQVQGEITASRALPRNETGDEHGHMSHHWTAEVTYRYVVNGQTYTGRRIRALGLNHFDEASAQAELAPFPVGAKVPVYHHPEQPGTSVLIPG
jgi:hypothetical protein